MIYGELAEEQQQTDCSFIYSCSRDARPPISEVISAPRVFRHLGMHVIDNSLYRGSQKGIPIKIDSPEGPVSDASSIQAI